MFFVFLQASVSILGLSIKWRDKGNDMKVHKTIEGLNVELEINEFRKIVQHEKRFVPWVVLFGNPTCGPCQNAKAQLLPAAEKLINFTNVRYFSLEGTDIASEYDIKTVPSYKIFYNNSVFNITPKPRNYMGIFNSFFDEMSRHIPINSQTMNKDKKKVILVTKRKSSPLIFTQSHAMFSRFGIKFHIVTDHAIAKEFTNSKTSIVFVNNGNIKEYSGKKDINYLANAIIEFFNLGKDEL